MGKKHAAISVQLALLLPSLATAVVNAQTLIRPSQNIPAAQAPDQPGAAARAEASRAESRRQPSPSLYVGQPQSNARTLLSPESVMIAPMPSVTDTEEARLLGPGFPVRVSDVAVTTRGVVIVDSTRLDPQATGLFLPSAIPVEGEPFYGTSERATVQGQGSSVALAWFSSITPASPLHGAVRLEVLSLTTDDFRVNTPQAWLSWQDTLFGITDSVFTDVDANPDTIDLHGPNGRPYFMSGHAQIRVKLWEPVDRATDPSGFYIDTSVEAPRVDVYVPSNQGYATFARYPDCLAAVKYKEGEWQTNPCTGAQVYDEAWHVRIASVVRDLGVERSDDTVREGAIGWGGHLSGRITVFRDSDPCDMWRDYLFMSFTSGSGIGDYFTDLRTISSTNDAAYNSVTNTVTALPLTAFFAGYQHQWTDSLRSTAVYSQIELDSQQIPGGSLTTLPYRRGQYASINLMYHLQPCVQEDKKVAEHSLFAGIEYLYGLKENLRGATGDDHRVMFVVAASK